MIKKPKLTPWIDGCIRPAIPGVYERQFRFEKSYSRWTGVEWQIGYYRVVNAADSTTPSIYPSLKWRGLADKP